MRLPLHVPESNATADAPHHATATREYTDLVPAMSFDKTRSTPFSYDCKACSRCCRDKVIRVSPYETLRLARQLGMSTTDFIARYTEGGGTVLQARSDGSCVFLGEKGCTVHPDRPLVCRIYPLSWFMDGQGNETFGVLEGHPQSEGVFADRGTVDDYCKSQKLDPYIDVAKRYIDAHDRLLNAMRAQAESPEPVMSEILEKRSEVEQLDVGTLASSWLDVDATVRLYCEARSLPIPTEIDAIVDTHLAALDAWCDSLS